MPLEAALGGAWSIGEVALSASRLDELRHDPHREIVLGDIEARGLHPALEPSSIRMAMDAAGRIEGTNPYARLSGEPSDRILAHLARSRRGPSRHLVLVCHCYGVPSPALMSRLFGLGELPVDVCTNIMTHHQPGTYPLWPGSGFTSARLSELVENLRAAVTGARTVLAWARRQRPYERVVVVGFSIGGHLALHLANAADVDAVVAYAPMTNLHASVTELGLMRRLHGPVERLVRRRNPHFDLRDLAITDPLAHPLRIPPRDLHVVVQRHDVMATPSQIAAIRRTHPDIGWHELPGTHVLPAGVDRLHALVRSLVLADDAAR